MFGNESKPSRIYSYKAHDPVEMDHAMGQMRSAHRYRNRLIELERCRRDRVEEALKAHAPVILATGREIEDLDARIEDMERAIKARNQSERRRSTTAGERAGLATLKATRKEARRVLKEARAAAFADPGLEAALDAIDSEHAVAQKAARAACGCYWGTYLLVEQSLSAIRKGAPPRFRRWIGDGAIAVQLQGGLDWSGAIACSDLRLRVEVLPPGPDADPGSLRSRTTARAVAWMRAGSSGPGGRQPTWVRVPFTLHRPPPPGSRIKWAYLHRERVGVGGCWKFQLVLERDEWPRPHAGAGVVGIDVNWRSLPGGIRVAYAVGDDGREVPLFIPRDWLDRWTKVESLQSIRDRNFDEARALLARWKEGHDRTEIVPPERYYVTRDPLVPRNAENDVPDWFSERFAHLALWRSIDRLGSAVWHWKDHRFAGDEAIYPVMEAWRRQDRHLHEWRDHQHRKIVRRRDDLYRRFAVGLSKDYRTARIEDTDWKALKARPRPEEADAPAARTYGHIAAPGRLSALIREAFAVAEDVPAADTTRMCHACGTIDEFDAARELCHTCSGCGTRWDQDRNAAINLRDAGGGGARVRGEREDDAA